MPVWAQAVKQSGARLDWYSTVQWN
jgi:hypothetical protein